MPPRRNIIADSSDEDDAPVPPPAPPPTAPATIGAFKMKPGKKAPTAPPKPAVPKAAPKPMVPKAKKPAASKAKAAPPKPAASKAKAAPPKPPAPPKAMKVEGDDDAELLAAAEAADELPGILDDSEEEKEEAVVSVGGRGRHKPFSASVPELSLRDALKAITFPGATKLKSGDDDATDLKGVVQVEVLHNAAIFDCKGTVTAAPPMSLLGYGATIQGMVRQPTFTGLLLHFNEFGVRSGTCAIECDVKGVPDGEYRVAHIESTDMLSELRVGRLGNAVLMFNGNTVGVVGGRDADSGLCFAELVQVECAASDLPRRILPVMFDEGECPKRHATLVADGAWLYNELTKVVHNGREAHSIEIHSDGRRNRIVRVVAVTEGRTKSNFVAWECAVGRGDVLELRKRSATAAKRQGESLGGDGKRRRAVGGGIPADADDDDDDDEMGLGAGAPMLTFGGKPAAAAPAGDTIPADVDPFAVAAEVERTKAKVAAMDRVYSMCIDMFSLLKVFESIRESVAKVWLHLFDGILILNARLLNGTLLAFSLQGKVE